MVTGLVVGVIWIFFIHEKEASSLQLCMALFGKTSIVKDTMFAKLAMVDPIIVALPSSIIATIIGSFSTKNDIPKEHVDRCFNGI